MPELPEVETICRALAPFVEGKKLKHLEILDHLGDVHIALGERSAAVAVWKKGLDLATESKRDQQRKAEVEKKVKAAEQ